MDTTNDEGWIKLHRKIEKSAVFQNEGLLKIWVWCLLKANHQDEWVPITTGKGTTEVLVKRGQFIFGRKSAAKQLKMRPSTVQDRIKKLANMQNLVTQSVTHYSLVSICNYEHYQGDGNITPSPNPSPIRQPTVTNKNDKNEKNIGRRKENADPRVKIFFTSWEEMFQKETGQPYVFSFGKDGSLVKNLLQIHPLERLQEITRVFFRDEQAKRRGLTIGIFSQEVNRLVSQKSMDPIEQARRELF